MAMRTVLRVGLGECHQDKHIGRARISLDCAYRPLARRVDVSVSLVWRE